MGSMISIHTFIKVTHEIVQRQRHWDPANVLEHAFRVLYEVVSAKA